MLESDAASRRDWRSRRPDAEAKTVFHGAGTGEFPPGRKQAQPPSFEYRFSPRNGVFINARNLTNVAQVIQRYAPILTPSWSRTYRREEFGTPYTVGVKGTF